MNKLTLEHLAGYFEHDIKCELLDYKRDYIGEKYGILRGFYKLRNDNYYMFKGREYAGKSAKNIKPILHPWSDIIKEIEHNGEKLVPIDEIKDIVMMGAIRLDQWDMLRFLITDDYTNKSNLPYWVIQWLYKHHFAIDIPEDLYIDINTI